LTVCKSADQRYNGITSGFWRRHLAGFEDLIRGALIKQDSTTKEGREKVYYSARQALTRMTTKNGSLAPDVIESQHQKLELAIVEIEAS